MATEMNWRKSSYSHASPASDCVEVGTALAKSSHSGESACVEAGPCACGRDVFVRDSKDRSGPVLRFTQSEWRAFVAGAKDGEFDI